MGHAGGEIEVPSPLGKCGEQGVRIGVVDGSASDHDVLAASAEKEVTVVAANHDIAFLAADEKIVAVTTDEYGVATAGLHQVGALAAIEQRRHTYVIFDEHDVIAVAAQDDHLGEIG